MHRALLMTDGRSDLALSNHVQRICNREQAAVEVVPLAQTQLPPGTGRRVGARLSAALGIDSGFQCIFVHRDAENAPPERREQEVEEGVDHAGFGGPWAPIVPVRMTEAWLLLDEQAIREVAGRPSGREDLDLPSPGQVEGIADPKMVLQQALINAARVKGRHLKRFCKQFRTHRRRLIEQLDPDGPVSNLLSWQRMVTNVQTAVHQLGSCCH